jgi:hypothetical protein
MKAFWNLGEACFGTLQQMELCALVKGLAAGRSAEVADLALSMTMQLREGWKLPTWLFRWPCSCEKVEIGICHLSLLDWRCGRPPIGRLAGYNHKVELQRGGATTWDLKSRAFKRRSGTALSRSTVLWERRRYRRYTEIPPVLQEQVVRHSRRPLLCG